MVHLVSGGGGRSWEQNLKTWMRASSERGVEQDKMLRVGEVRFVWFWFCDRLGTNTKYNNLEEGVTVEKGL